MKWITALNLQQWAETLSARADFPALVADLIRASAPATSAFRFVSGDKAQVRGFDGYLQASGVPPYVPDGPSIWEFGVSGSGASKATKDFEKRTNEIDEARRQVTTFVIATPYTWDTPQENLQTWVDAKRKLRLWKNVEYLDGVTIEHWLDEHPAVAVNFARHVMSLVPHSDVMSVRQYWDEYSARFLPPLSEKVLLCERDEQARKLLEDLAGVPRAIKLAADSPDEVLAFAAAAILSADAELRQFLEARSVVLTSEEAVRMLAVKKGMVFLPKGQALNNAGILTKAGPTLIAIGGDERRREHDVLPRPTSGALGAAFASMGYSPQDGYTLARKCGRSVTVLSRLISSGRAGLPEWSNSAADLIPAMLAGAWLATSELDRQAIKELAGGADYDSVESRLRELATLKDPPLDIVDDLWKLRAPIDAFMHVGRLIGPVHLTRLKDVATKVFTHVVEKPSPEELFDVRRQKPADYSDWLRDGLATTLLHIAVLHQEVNLSIPEKTPQAYVDEIVASLPGLRSDARLISSLRDRLPLLAEAAPDPLLSALEHLLEGNGDLIRPIFAESDDLFAPGSPHTGVLFALEMLAWSPKHLSRVAVILARLTELDPGGRLSNRPLSSLRAIFLSWSPNTYAPLAQRIAVLDLVIRVVPSIAWSLIETLLPKSHDTSTSASKPLFREDGATEAERLTNGIVWESQRQIVARALELATNDRDRLESVIKAMDKFDPESRGRACDKIEHYLESAPIHDRERLWKALQKEVNRHKTFSGAGWAYSNDELNRLDEIVKKHAPPSLVSKVTWLFDEWDPDVPGKLDRSLELVEEERRRAIRGVFESEGLDGIMQLVQVSKLSRFVAQVLDAINLDVTDYVTLVRYGIGGSEEMQFFSVIASSIALNVHGNVWIEAIQELGHRGDFTPKVIASLLLAFPDDRNTWKIALAFGDEVDAEYWRRKNHYRTQGDADDLIHAVRKYVEVERAVAAITLIHERSRDIPVDLIFEVLQKALSEINEKKVLADSMLEYYLGPIFDDLESRPDAERQRVAQQEYAFLPLLERRKEPLLLHRLLTTTPSLFVSVICDVFRAASGPRRDGSPEERERAHASFRLLNSTHVLPGQNGNHVDYDALVSWIAEVRKLAKEADREEIADQYIGRLLAHAPYDEETGSWPHSVVKRVIDYFLIENIETGIIVERINMRGVYSKSIGEGGVQERVLAQEARKWAKDSLSFPRTSAVLNRLADSWEKSAVDEDVRAEKDKLRF